MESDAPGHQGASTSVSAGNKRKNDKSNASAEALFQKINESAFPKWVLPSDTQGRVQKKAKQLEEAYSQLQNAVRGNQWANFSSEWVDKIKKAFRWWQKYKSKEENQVLL